MELTASRVVDAPADVVWRLQLAHAQWPTHIPNFTAVEPLDPARFGAGSTVRITQAGLGTVEWTVDEFADTGPIRSFAWSGRAKGASYVGTHRVVAEADGRTRLTLGLIATGGLVKVVGPMLKGTMQKAIDAEADCFVRWAADVQAGQTSAGQA